MNSENEDASGRLLRLLSPIHERAVLTARRLSRSREDGDDLFQDASLRALSRLSTLRDESRFRPWFFAILFTLHRQRHRRGMWRRFCSFDTVPEPRGPSGFQDDGADRVAAALATLSAQEREALVLAELSGFSLEEVAKEIPFALPLRPTMSDQ